MPEILQVYNNDLTYAIATYDSDWINCTSSKILVWTVYNDKAFDMGVRWAVDDQFQVIDTDTISVLAGNTGELFFNVKARFVRFFVANIAVQPSILKTQGFFFKNGSEPLSNVTLTSAGGTSLVNDGIGPTLVNKGLTAGTSISFVDSGNDITINATGANITLGSAGGTSLVNDGVGPALLNKGITAGTAISFVDSGSDITINAATSASSVWQLVSGDIKPITGTSNLISGQHGLNTMTTSTDSCILGGYSNKVTDALSSTVSGLRNESQGGNYHFIGGGRDCDVKKNLTNEAESCCMLGSTSSTLQASEACGMYNSTSSDFFSADKTRCKHSAIISCNDGTINGAAAGAEPNGYTVIAASQESTITSMQDSAIIGCYRTNMTNTHATSAARGNVCVGGRNTRIEGSAINGCIVGGGNDCDILQGNDSGIFCSEDSFLRDANVRSVIMASDICTIQTDGTRDCVVLGGLQNTLQGCGECIILGSSLSNISGTIVAQHRNNGIYNSENSNQNVTEHCVIMGGEAHSIGNAGLNRAVRNVIIGGTTHDIRDDNDNNFIAGGKNNIINAINKDNNMMLGSNMTCDHSGCVMLGDDNATRMTSGANDEMSCRFNGGYRLYTNDAQSTGMTMTVSSWAAVCERSKKENIVELNYTDILNRVKNIPIYKFNYIGSDPEKVNYNCMAEDWHKTPEEGGFRCPDMMHCETEQVDGEDVLVEKGIAPGKSVKTIEQGDQISVLMACVKGLLSKIEILETRLFVAGI
jgi:hypothetical protein